MEQEIRETYVKIINSLFDGSVVAQPEYITDEVIEMADKMFDEIAACHERIRPLAILADGIAGSVFKLLPNELTFLFGNVSFANYLKSTTRDQIMKALRQKKTNAALKVMEAFIESWLKYTAKDRRLKVCIVTAQANWRSPITTALDDAANLF